MIWIALVLASLLSVCGQLCQKQATRPVSVRARKRYITQWIGLALASLGPPCCYGWRFYKTFLSVLPIPC